LAPVAQIDLVEKRMLWKLLVMAGAAVLSATVASASPVTTSGGLSLKEAEAPFARVHHKPWHAGGPPWVRGGYQRQEWREGYMAERVTVCRTAFRTEFDPYAGVYVRRPIRLCRERYGYEY
jgi:hypothetical protein